jgi:Fe-S cluster biosynthesis and repair protein YggX
MGKFEHQREQSILKRPFHQNFCSESRYIMARREVTITVVDCVKLGRELPALERQPFPGELGERIFNNVSAQAWDMWQQQATILINHYGLNMADPNANAFLFEQMEEFFFGEGAQMPEDWTPPQAAPRKK